ncbi:MAG: response regulator [Oligoflexia bacterium]|nr:response regulator [Oligoflexia bacterium]
MLETTISNNSILIIDDEDIYRDMLSQQLKSHIENIFIAANAEDALIILSTRTIDLTIIDIRLPGTSGIELLRIITKRYPYVVNIILTRYGDREDIKNALRYRAFDFIDKPHENDYLITTVRKGIVYKKDLDKLLRENEEKTVTIEQLCSIVEKKNKSSQENVAYNIEKAISPILRSIKDYVSGQKSMAASDSKKINFLIEKLEENFEEVNLAFYKKINNLNYKLSSSELEICRLIKRGYQTKEIANIIHNSSMTIKTHLKSIRRKLGISGKKIKIKNFLDEL